MIRTGSTTSIVVATVAGLAVLGVAGYRMMAGDCSSCAITGAEISVVETAATKADGCCALMGDSAEATLVATEGTSCSTSACDSEAKAACGEATSCCSSDAGAVEMVSTEAAGDSATTCGDACAGDACGVDAEACCGKCDKGQELAKAPQ